MTIIPKADSQMDQWRSVMFLYDSALKKVNTKIEILNNEFNSRYDYNPIEHIKSRLKSADSIVKKLKKDGYEVTIETMMEHLSDIAGVRIICSFISDIYQIADMIARQDDVTVLHVKDYIKHPKPNGYKSYHLVTGVPIYRVDGMEYYPVEIQFRTMAMDLWASLEHRSCYKRREEDKQAWSDWFLKYSRILEQMEQEVAEYGRGQAIQPPSAASPGTATAGTSDPGHS